MERSPTGSDRENCRTRRFTAGLIRLPSPSFQTIRAFWELRGEIYCVAPDKTPGMRTVMKDFHFTERYSFSCAVMHSMPSITRGSVSQIPIFSPARWGSSPRRRLPPIRANCRGRSNSTSNLLDCGETGSPQSSCRSICGQRVVISRFRGIPRTNAD